MKNYKEVQKEVLKVVKSEAGKSMAASLTEGIKKIFAPLIEAEEAEYNKIDWTRVNNDTNGNPRYVCHFLEFITEEDRELSISDKYTHALNKARKIGGRKFHNKQYGGGIVFQSYNIESTEARIKELLKTGK